MKRQLKRKEGGREEEVSKTVLHGKKRENGKTGMAGCKWEKRKGKRKYFAQYIIFY